MKLVSSDHLSFLQMDRKSVQKEYFPCFEYSISVQCHLFSGFQSVWLEQAELVRFYNHLKEVCAHGFGSAILTAMSPNEFQISIEGFATKGNFLLKIALRKVTYINDVNIFHRFEGGFVLDSNVLDFFLTQLQKEAFIESC